LPSTHYSGGASSQKTKGVSRTTSESSEADTSPPPTSALASSPHALLHHKDNNVVVVGPLSYSQLHNGRSDVDQDVDDHERMIKDGSPIPEIRLQTFFSRMDASFIDIRLTSDLEIPIVPFLDACRSILPIFDKLHQTAFAPARLDIASNIKRIHQKYLISPEIYISLQKMIASEMQSRQSHLATSATSAILWLNRSLEFIHEIIHGFLSSSVDDDLVTIVNAAYTKTLIDYHGWVLRGAFAMSVRAVPSRTEFIRCFSLDDGHVNHPSFLTSLVHDMEDHDMALTTVTRLLHDFLRQNNLDSSEQV
jgi:pleckstrin family protein A (phosphoinositide binding specific) protein 8